MKQRRKTRTKNAFIITMPNVTTLRETTSRSGSDLTVMGRQSVSDKIQQTRKSQVIASCLVLAESGRNVHEQHQRRQGPWTTQALLLKLSTRLVRNCRQSIDTTVRPLVLFLVIGKEYPCDRKINITICFFYLVSNKHSGKLAGRTVLRVATLPGMCNRG
jgi:hypothetical protein